MNRPITGFHSDSNRDWVAELSCGHTQHVRHAPPFTLRPWVETAEGREAQIGQLLDCALCDRAAMPEGFESYQRTADFTETSLPDALRNRHATKAGVWALIHVERGELEYRIHEPIGTTQQLAPGKPGTVIAEVPHEVHPRGSVSLYVEFWRKAR